MGWWSQDSKKKSNNNNANASFDSGFDSSSLQGLGNEFLEKAQPYLPENVHAGASNLLSTTWTANHSILLGTACTATFLLGFRVGRVRPVWRAVTSLQDLSSADIGASTAWMRGTVVSVSDGDTIRFLHRPTIFHSSSNFDKRHRLALRLCTIDTPETAKFGKPGQAFGEEAKEHLKSLCLDQTVRVKILQIDQYGRGVAQVVRPGWIWNTYLDEAMLKAGLAEVYQGSGAVYGSMGKEAYLQIMEKAKSKGIGVWSDPDRESAAEYKRRTST